MNKKLMLFASLVMPATLVVGSLAFVTNRQVNRLAKGEGVPSTFELDYSDVELIAEDTYQISLKKTTDSEKEVRVNVVGASYHDGKLFAKGEGQDFYFYNIDPIRGIQNASFTVNETSGSADIGLGTMISYNELDLDDVYDGKYQDLMFFSSAESFSGSQDFILDYNSMPFLLDYRHFLVFLVPFSDNLSLTDMSVQTACEEEPTPVSIGTNEGVLSSDDLDRVNSLYHGSLSITKMGNGLWEWSDFDGTDYLSMCYEPSTISGLEQAIIDSGFTHTLTYDGALFYQKQDGDDVHTIIVSKDEFNYVAHIQSGYASDYPYFDKGASWPAQFISDNFEHASIVPGVPDSVSTQYVEQYNFARMDEDGNRSILILVSPKAGLDKDDLVDLINAYKGLVSTAGWIISSEESDSFGAQSADNLAYIFVGYQDGSVVFNFQEAIIYDEPPTASKIANDMLWPNASDVVIFNGGTGARYKYGNARYDVIGAQSGSFDNFKSALLTAGYTLQSEYSENWYYNKVVDIFGSTLDVNIYLDTESGNYSVYYYYQNRQSQATQHSDFAEMLKSVTNYSSEDIANIASSLTYLSNYEYYSLWNDFAIVLNAGSEFVSQFASIPSITYLPIHDAYKVDDSGMLLKVTLADGGVKLQAKWCYPTDLVDYQAYNTRLDEYILENSRSTSNCAIYFNSSDDLEMAFTNRYSEFYYYGTLTEVNRVKNLYASRILENTNFAYSAYLDAYIHKTEAFGYQLLIEQSDSLYYLRIIWTTNSYADYQSYNDLDMDTCTLFSYYPDFISSSDYDEELFVNYYGGSDGASFELKKEYGISSFVSALESAGFVNNNDIYSKFINDRVYNVSIYEYSATYYFNFYAGFTFYDSSTFTGYLSSDTLSMLADFEFNDYFNSTSNLYLIEKEEDQKLTYYSADLSANVDFINNLTSNLGFSYDSTADIYYKANGAQTQFDFVTISDRATYALISIEKTNYSFMSWSDIESALISGGHAYDTFKNYVVYPDDSIDEVYSLSLLDYTTITLRIRKSYDMSTYTNRIENDANFTGHNGDEYYFQNGQVTIHEYFDTYEVNVRCWAHDGSTPETALPAYLGDNAFPLYQSYTYFAFTPEISGTYKFESSVDSNPPDPKCSLFDSDMLMITEDDDGAGFPNFSLKWELEAGKTYYIGIYSLSGSDGIPFSFNISMVL